MNQKSTYLFTLLFVLVFFNAFSQVGIGTTEPHASSILDVTSTEQGLLAPRMTSAQRLTIATPAEGLLVFDTDENVFYFFDGTTWLPLESAEKRDNYKLIKSAADLADELAAGGGTVYLLDPDTLYEINGTITLAVPININDAYIFGEDTNGDVLVSTGTIFEGVKGGSIKGITLISTGGSVFNLNGTGDGSLIFRDSAIVNSNSVGTVSDFKLVFLSIVRYSNNLNGITYTDIEELLLNSAGWDGLNKGTYETLTGIFNIITKQGGFSTVEETATAAFDVTGITSITGSAGMRNVSFSGDGNYVNGSSPYIGYNFTNDWDVNCPGLKVETDNNATGDINLDYSVGSGATTAFSGTGMSSRTKLSGNTTSENLFRFRSSPGINNRIIYDGMQTRFFNVSASVSFQGDNNNAVFVFYILKNGSILEETKVYREVGENNDVGALAIIGTIELSTNDYIEVWVERYSGAGNLLAVSMNLSIR
ncbi:hypothetical protein ACFFU9_12475 [Mariniflexile ostreae]|uniref:Cell wall anchor protein n=1 Tax=Mariniflexile ostreae TaxID=1520892 RepID=A0ABV5FDM9_9FLAO